MFEKLKELFTKHPYLIGGGALVLFIFLYYYFSSGSSSGSTITGSTSSTDAQTAALNAQEQIAQLQAQTQLSAVSIQAGVQEQQIAAAQDVTNNQTAAQLEGLKSNNDTQVQIAQVQAGQNEAQVKALEDIVTAQYTAQENASNNAYDYLSTLANNQAYIQSQGINAQVTLDQAALSHVKDVGGSQNRTAIILGATGNIPGSIAAENGQTLSSMSGDSLLSSIGKSAGSALSALIG